MFQSTSHDKRPATGLRRNNDQKAVIPSKQVHIRPPFLNSPVQKAAADEEDEEVGQKEEVSQETQQSKSGQQALAMPPHLNTPIQKSTEEDEDVQTEILQKEDDEEKSPDKSKLPKEEKSTNDPTILLGRKLLKEFPTGVSVMFYEIDDTVFAGEALRWATDNNAIGFKGSSVNVNNISFGTPIPEYVTRKTKEGKVKVEIDSLVGELSSTLKTAVEKAAAFDGGTVNTDAAKISTLAIGAHGWEMGTSVNIDKSNYKDFVSKVSPYLTTGVNVIFYACTAAIADDEAHNSWYSGVHNYDGGKNSLLGKMRDELSDNGHSKATVWGHTAVGHYLNNYTLRSFDADKKGKDGESFVLDVFDIEMYGYVDQVFSILTDEGISIDETQFQEIYNYILKYTRSDLTKCYAKANSSIKMDIGSGSSPQERALSERAPLEPQKVTEKIIEYRKDNWKKDFDPTDIVEKTAEHFRTKLKTTSK